MSTTENVSPQGKIGKGGTVGAAFVVSVMVIELISGFSQGFYEPLLPTVGEEMGVDASGLQLFNVVPTAIAAILVPFLTRMSDLYGFRKILRIVVPTIFLGSLLIFFAGVFSTYTLVLVGRIFHGVIPVLMPVVIALVYARTSPVKAATYASALVAFMTLGTLLGTSSGGFVYAALGSLSRALLVVPLLQLISVAIVWFVFPEFVTGADTHIDAKGFIGLGIVMLLAIVGFTEVVEGGIESALGALLIVAALIVGVVWYRYQKRAEHPAIDVKVMFTRKLFPLYVGAMCYGAVFYGFLSPVATYLAADPSTLGYGYAFNAQNVSIAQGGITLATVIAASVLPIILKRVNAKYALLTGFTLAFVAFVQWLVPGDTLLKLVVFIVLVGLGIGTVAAAIPVIIPKRATEDTRGVATGLFNSSQTLGGALGGGLFVSLLKVGATADGAITIIGYDVVWTACAVFLALGFVVVAVFLTKDENA